MRSIVIIFCLISAIVADKLGQIVIEHTQTPDTIVYIDGDKVGMLEVSPYSLKLPAGRHEIMLLHPLDEAWHEVFRKVIIIKSGEQTVITSEPVLEKIAQKHNRSTQADFRKEQAHVIDAKRASIWQDDMAVTQVKRTWEQAQNYCRSLVLDGMHEWRLPTYDELITIVDYHKHTLAAMPAFKNVVSESFWTATSDEENDKKAKNIYFGNGCPDTALKSKPLYVRCVRKQ